METTIRSFEQLQCRKLAMQLYSLMSNHAKKSHFDLQDEVVCRWLISSLHIGGKIAFAFGAEDYEWFKEWLPLARKYCLECAFWTRILEKKGLLHKSTAQEYIIMIKRILKKVDAIIRYLEKYADKEQHDWQVFFGSYREE